MEHVYQALHGMQEAKEQQHSAVRRKGHRPPRHRRREGGFRQFDAIVDHRIGISEPEIADRLDFGWVEGAGTVGAAKEPLKRDLEAPIRFSVVSAYSSDLALPGHELSLVGTVAAS